MNSKLQENSGAIAIVKTLLKNGIKTFFGIPGGPVCPIFEALRIVPGVKLIESRHETNAAFAAAAYYKTTGEIPAVVVTAGPGITNVVTGVASAYLEQVPMIVISGDVSYSTNGGILAQDCGTEGLQIENMFKPITNAQIRLSNSKSIVSQTIDAIMATNSSDVPRPVLLIAPLDKTTAEAEAGTTITRAKLRKSINDNVNSDVISKVVDILLSAKHPLLVFGGATKQYSNSIESLVSYLKMPFITTPRGKGVVSELNEFSLRNGGMAASWWARNYTKDNVDVALVLGTDLDDTSIGPTPYIGNGGKLIHVDVNCSVFNRNLPTTLGIQCDIEVFIEELILYIERKNIKFTSFDDKIKQYKSVSPFDVNDFQLDNSKKITPHRALADIQAAVGVFGDPMFITDIGEHMLFALHYLTATDSNAFNIQLNLGSMGSGICGAIGMALGNKSRRVVCICGDGGMQMSGMEILTAIKENLPIIYVVFNDGRYNMVHHGMKQIFGEANTYNTSFINFKTWADAIGIKSAIINEPGQITKEMIHSLSDYKMPILLDVRIDSSTRIRGGGRVEALQHMSMLSDKGNK